jgi:hypothetical protein
MSSSPTQLKQAMEFEVQAESGSPGIEFVRAISFTHSSTSLEIRYILDNEALATTFDLCDLISTYFVSHVENVKQLEIFQEIILVRKDESIDQYMLAETIEMTELT